MVMSTAQAKRREKNTNKMNPMNSGNYFNTYYYTNILLRFNFAQSPLITAILVGDWRPLWNASSKVYEKRMNVEVKEYKNSDNIKKDLIFWPLNTNATFKMIECSIFRMLWIVFSVLWMVLLQCHLMLMMRWL